MQYLLTLPMMVLAFKDNHQSAVSIPAGKFIEVVCPVENDDRFLLIWADDGQFHIFASDLARRAKPVVARTTVRGFSEESLAPESKTKRGSPGGLLPNRQNTAPCQKYACEYSVRRDQAIAEAVAPYAKPRQRAAVASEEDQD
jgi:hypothetical protein